MTCVYASIAASYDHHFLVLCSVISQSRCSFRCGPMHSAWPVTSQPKRSEIMRVLPATEDKVVTSDQAAWSKQTRLAPSWPYQHGVLDRPSPLLPSCGFVRSILRSPQALLHRLLMRIGQHRHRVLEALETKCSKAIAAAPGLILHVQPVQVANVGGFTLAQKKSQDRRSGRPFPMQCRGQRKLTVQRESGLHLGSLNSLARQPTPGLHSASEFSTQAHRIPGASLQIRRQRLDAKPVRSQPSARIAP